jgi:hypothetical protein
MAKSNKSKNMATEIDGVIGCLQEARFAFETDTITDGEACARLMRASVLMADLVTDAVRILRSPKARKG